MLRTASTFARLAVASALSTTPLQEDAPAVPHGGRELRGRAYAEGTVRPVGSVDGAGSV